MKSGTMIKELKGHTKGILQVLISSDNLYIASASADMTVRLWEISSG